MTLLQAPTLTPPTSPSPRSSQSAAVFPLSIEAGQQILLENIRWETYEHLREDLDLANSHVKLTYDTGRLEIFVLSPRHEWGKKLVAQLIELALIELDIPKTSFGSTTFKRADLAKGLEPDECYYIQNATRVHSDEEFDLTRNPP